MHQTSKRGMDQIDLLQLNFTKKGHEQEDFDELNEA